MSIFYDNASGDAMTAEDRVLIAVDAPWQTIYTDLSEETKDAWYSNIEEGTGRRYNKADMTARKPGGDTQYERNGRSKRKDGRLCITVEDLLSPSIMERLTGQEGVLSPQIADRRWIVDSIAVDTADDGHVFDVDHIDIPERRSDLVAGEYELEPPAGDRPAAVRITDMLGQGILVVEQR